MYSFVLEFTSIAYTSSRQVFCFVSWNFWFREAYSFAKSVRHCIGQLHWTSTFATISGRLTTFTRLNIYYIFITYMFFGHVSLLLTVNHLQLPTDSYSTVPLPTAIYAFLQLSTASCVYPHLPTSMIIYLGLSTPIDTYLHHSASIFIRLHQYAPICIRPLVFKSIFIHPF